jgi:hypothetical protein
MEAPQNVQRSRQRGREKRHGAPPTVHLQKEGWSPGVGLQKKLETREQLKINSKIK